MHPSPFDLSPSRFQGGMLERYGGFEKSQPDQVSLSKNSLFCIFLQRNYCARLGRKEWSSSHFFIFYVIGNNLSWSQQSGVWQWLGLLWLHLPLNRPSASQNAGSGVYPQFHDKGPSFFGTHTPGSEATRTDVDFGLWASVYPCSPQLQVHLPFLRACPFNLKSWHQTQRQQSYKIVLHSVIYLLAWFGRLFPLPKFKPIQWEHLYNSLAKINLSNIPLSIIYLSVYLS